MKIEEFITRWKDSGGRERANYQLFLTELCDALEVPRPDPARQENSRNAYTFERSVTRVKPDGTSSTVFLDLYKSGCFVLETKQGASAEPGSETGDAQTGHGKRGSAGYDKAMERAYNQASNYVRDLPASEGRPPFLVVCDVGHVFELYAEFTCTGGRYQRFPDPKSHRIFLDDLRDEAKRDLLRSLWLDPLSLDPSKRVARVTQDIAARLATLAAKLERGGKHDPSTVALFLQRCLFTMFAEDIGLLPQHGFLELLKRARVKPEGFPALVTTLWKEMAEGASFSVILSGPVRHFNGGLFEQPSALALDPEAIDLLITAAEADWKDVDPAIFGTLLERALDSRERHKLGAHFTPRSYVERLIEPAVIQPLREEWEAVKAAAIQLLEEEKIKVARKEVDDFHHRICQLHILDPACGSGNFLYVALEHLKILEAEVVDFLESIGGHRTLEMEGTRVRPHQFHGLEINPSAVRIAQLVLWIGYFQWHYRTTGKADTNEDPLLRKEDSILHQDAVLAYDEKIPRKDADGNAVTIWDGRTTKAHPVTGKEVPDESARIRVYDYTNPRRPEWPEADFIVGNPPFVGASRMRDALGDGYTEAVRKAWKGDVPESADFVMFWWQRCAELVRAGKIRRFGLITTNSIHQTFNRRVLEQNMNAQENRLHLAFAIPDHPWVDSGDGAAVRIAMTVGEQESSSKGELKIIRNTNSGEDVVLESQVGTIHSNLKIGCEIAATSPLKANSAISNRGFCLFGEGFIIERTVARELEATTVPHRPSVMREYRNGKDLTGISRNLIVIDAFGLNEQELMDFHPGVYQHLLTTVKLEREQNRRETRRKFWWIFGEPNKKLRDQLAGLSRYIATPETSKHRFFVFLDQSILPDNKLVNIALDDAAVLGILSSSIHIIWALATGARLEDRPVYVKSKCFETFPFPEPDAPTKERIRELGEKLDAHRKRQQAEHPGLTLTGMYNVLEKLRTGEALTEKEKEIHEKGLVSVLKQIHDNLDEAVFHAYGWDDLWKRFQAGRGATEAVEAELLARLVKLNHERAEEEKNGTIRWLRPEFQNREDKAGGQELPLESVPPSETASEAEGPAEAGTKAPKIPWPKELSAQVAIVQKLAEELGPDPKVIAGRFDVWFSRKAKIAQIIDTLVDLGRI